MHSRGRAPILRISCRVYGFLSPLYPAALRAEFAADMLDVFEQKIRDESERHGFTGVARVWWCVVSEVITSARPTDFLWARIGVPVASVLASLALFECFIRATHTVK